MNDPKLTRLAWWLDSSIPIPGLKFRFGLDALLGLIPGVGDLAGTALSSIILIAAARRGAPASILLRMGVNIALEALIGIVPILGDVFDVVWKANQRNVRLLAEYGERPADVRRRSGWLMASLLAGVLALLAGVAFAAYWVLRWLLHAAQG